MKNAKKDTIEALTEQEMYASFRGSHTSNREEMQYWNGVDCGIKTAIMMLRGEIDAKDTVAKIASHLSGTKFDNEIALDGHKAGFRM